MFLTEKLSRSYVGLYQNLLYKILIINDPPPINILLTPNPIQQQLHLGQGAQCYVLLKNMLPSAVVSKHLTNTLSMQRVGNIHVTHQSQLTCHGISYEYVLFSSATFTRETFHCDKRFMFVREEGPDEGLFDKDPDPTPLDIHNSTAPPSAPGDPI